MAKLPKDLIANSIDSANSEQVCKMGNATTKNGEDHNELSGKIDVAKGKGVVQKQQEFEEKAKDVKAVVNEKDNVGDKADDHSTDVREQVQEAIITSIGPQLEQEDCEQQKLDTAEGDNLTQATIKMDSEQKLPKTPEQCKEFAKQVMAMAMGEEGDGDVNQIVMELLTSQAPDKSSIIERISDVLFGVLRKQTLIEAGIVIGNERYICLKKVIQNYSKLYAAKKFIEKLSSLYPQLFIEGDDEIFELARIVADEMLQIPELLHELGKSLEKMDFFNEDTAFKVYLETRHFPQAQILRELMLTRISRVFLCIVSSVSFLNFNEYELMHVLSSCYLSVNSEIEIFLSVILWLEHNWSERKNCAVRVMGGVRFSLLPIWYFSTLQRTNHCVHFARVVHMKPIQDMLNKGMNDAIELATKGSRYAKPKDDKEPEIEQPMPRDWIADPSCGYHHKCSCINFLYPNYLAFKSHLSKIMRFSPNYWRGLRPVPDVYYNELRCCTERTLIN